MSSIYQSISITRSLIIYLWFSLQFSFSLAIIKSLAKRENGKAILRGTSIRVPCRRAYHQRVLDAFYFTTVVHDEEVCFFFQTSNDLYPLNTVCSDIIYIYIKKNRSPISAAGFIMRYTRGRTSSIIHRSEYNNNFILETSRWYAIINISSLLLLVYYYFFFVDILWFNTSFSFVYLYDFKLTVYRYNSLGIATYSRAPDFY